MLKLNKPVYMKGTNLYYKQSKYKNDSFDDFLTREKIEVPKEYYNLIVKQNGGIINGVLRDIKFNYDGIELKIPNGEIPFGEFWGITELEFDNIVEQYNLNGDMKNQQLLGIGTDATGAIYYLGYGKENKGAVFVQVNDEDWIVTMKGYENLKNQDYPYIFKLANSFPEFLNCISLVKEQEKI